MAKASYDPTQYEGVHAVGLIFTRDFRWAFREQPKADLGIDAHAEVCRDGEPTGSLLALQIKAGESYCKERTERGFVYRGSLRHLRYWLNHPLPVVLVIYNPSQRQAYWQGISGDLAEATHKGWKIMVPFQNRLDETALPHILEFMETGSVGRQASIDSSVVDSASTVLRTLGTREIQSLRDEFTLRTSELVGDLTERLWRGEIAIQEWHDEMRREIKTTFICQYLLAKGGRNLMTKPDYARIGVMVGQQYKSLDVFVSDIVEERYKHIDVRAVVERSKLYITCGEVAFEMARTSRGGTDPEYISTPDGWRVGS
jgi:hypothetical protein